MIEVYKCLTAKYDTFLLVFSLRC